MSIVILTTKPQDYDIIMVLGANGDPTSTVTQDRIYNAVQAKMKWPQAKFLLTGNEKRGEVSLYKKLLAQMGHADFIEETESTTTWENMIFSKKFLQENDRVVIVTSEYHQARALAMAHAVGIKAGVFGKDPRRYKKALFFFWKERFSNSKYFPQMLLSRFSR